MCTNKFCFGVIDTACVSITDSQLVVRFIKRWCKTNCFLEILGRLGALFLVSGLKPFLVSIDGFLRILPRKLRDVDDGIIAIIVLARLRFWTQQNYGIRL